jgi:hypothetical protein
MNQAIRAILQSIKSENEQVQNEGLLQICLILEMNTYHLGASDRLSQYDNLLPRDLLLINLDKNDQYEIIDYLRELALSSDGLIGKVLWPMGKAIPSVGIESLLILIQKYSNKLDDDKSYQALISLENFLLFDDEGILSADIKNHLQQREITAFLLSKSLSDDPRLAEIAKRILEKVNL